MEKHAFAKVFNTPYGQLLITKHYDSAAGVYAINITASNGTYSRIDTEPFSSAEGADSLFNTIGGMAAISMAESRYLSIISSYAKLIEFESKHSDSKVFIVGDNIDIDIPLPYSSIRMDFVGAIARGMECAIFAVGEDSKHGELLIDQTFYTEHEAA